ncbi:SRPBCC domain-containing protein [Chroococcidiopsis sp. CCNUC1]|uniref:SRPBCC domain-containing protein n=2 Tax=Chroococcidiopsis sp. CCNUC1 TaxID=2653189 RepID=UPI0020201D47|nr:SRPBCC domain-containing protein [Chroococcidiopsis sp. CCNUC1]URD53501.1 SRPBCC domain-containing protein [Chroococcidiopsis sp. CCNUC1]
MAVLKVTVPENSQNILGIVTIDASLEKVFEAYVKEELFAQWWCRGNPMKVYRFDCRDGGSWHIAERSSDGNEYEFTGCFHEVAKNRRIVQTFEFLGMPERGHVMLEKAEFVAINDRTTEIRTHSTAMNQEDRDGMVASGMESGWRQSIEALGKLLESEN